MFGQGRPIVWKLYPGAKLSVRRWVGVSLGVLAFCWLSSICSAEQINVRLRMAWGSGDSAKHRWIGKISCPDAKLSDLQPLGIESDAAVAIRLSGNELIVNPWEKRGFDGCDITIEGEADSLVRFELHSEQSSAPTQLEVPLAKLATEQFREPLDSLGSFLLAYRSPGDRFRVEPTREHLIFKPGEIWPLKLKTDFAAELAQGPAVVEVVLRAIGSDAILWQSTQVITAESPSPNQLLLDVTCPNAEGAYRLSLSAKAEEGFATRFVPGQGVTPFATREIDLVVIDPQAKLPRLVDKWLPVLAIEPANPSWWQRLPTWAQVSRLTGKPLGSLGNVRLLSRETAGQGLVELPPSTNKQDPSWQSFTLPVQEMGVPHLVEIVYPVAEKQHLSLSIVEPDAAGRVMSTVLDSGFYVEEAIGRDGQETAVHRIVFWPKTASPQLLIVNRDASRPGVFGRISLSRHDDAAGVAAIDSEYDASARLVAGYIAKPHFAENLGAAEVLDPASGMSVESWSTFLAGAQRLTQQLKLSGYNSVLLSVAAEGSSLYPSQRMLPTPRHDTGMLAASGQDPVRKDVLEMLLQICDREQVPVIPTVQLAVPMPELEAAGANVAWIGAKGTQLIESRRSVENLSANYNLLDTRVQNAAGSMVLEVASRYAQHPAFAGLAIQLDSNGLGMLPGLEWGFDERTIAAFTADTGIEIGGEGNNRIPLIAAKLLKDHRSEWQAWRIKKTTEFYTKLSDALQQQKPGAKLILTTENLLNEPSLKQALRGSGTNAGRIEQLLAERGIDLKQLAAIPHVEVTGVHQLDSRQRLQQSLTDVVLNEITARRDLFPKGSPATNLVFRKQESSRLPSFNQQSPFGADRTHLVLAHQSVPTAQTRQQGFVATVAGGGLATVIEGGEFLSTTLDKEHHDFLKTLAGLPTAGDDARMIHSQPLVLNTTREGNDTFLTCKNESPWTVDAKLELDVSALAKWNRIGEISTTEGASGELKSGTTPWALTVPPYGVLAWRVESPQLKVRQLQVIADLAARNYLMKRIEEIESRTGNLDIVRDYAQLQNPGFELEEGTARIFGWQAMKAAQGAIEISTTDARSGERSLLLQSVDNIGVAVQSHLFPVPETGMLVVTAKVRTTKPVEGAKITMAVETDQSGPTYRRTRAYAAPAEFNDQWSTLELVVSDLPVGDADQVRVQFHVTGAADVLLDDVALCDLRFDDARRTELVKRVFAAKTALQEDQVVDCLRLIDQYWPRYLVEYVPPRVRDNATLAKQPNPAEKAASEEDAKSGRWRKLVPRILR
jgi:hypothetical protein